MGTNIDCENTGWDRRDLHGPKHGTPKCCTLFYWGYGGNQKEVGQ